MVGRHPVLKDDVETAVSLGIAHMVMGIVCVGMEYAMVQHQCYLYDIGVPLWSGTLFLATGGVGVALKNSQTSKMVRDYFSLSIISVFVAMVAVTYGSIAAWADFQDGKTTQGGFDIGLALVALGEFSIAIYSAVVASRLRTLLIKLMPLRTLSTYETNKDRTIILMPMSDDEIPVLYLSDGHTVSDVKIKN